MLRTGDPLMIEYYDSTELPHNQAFDNPMPPAECIARLDSLPDGAEGMAIRLLMRSGYFQWAEVAHRRFLLPEDHEDTNIALVNGGAVTVSPSLKIYSKRGGLPTVKGWRP